MTRKCSKCNVEKSLEDFYASSTSRGGKCTQCKDCQNARTCKIIRKKRMEVIRHYSKGLMKCSCCGEKRFEFLSIDHINGRVDGEIHVGGSYLYRKLIRENFPPGFQVLCYNCNCAKGFCGYCPHQKETVVVILEREEEAANALGN